MMLAETFLREFASLASGPGGVQRLRDLVLQLAVRGGLSTPSLSDDNIGDLCSILPGEIEKQIADGIGIRRKEIKYDAAKPPYCIRETWRWVRLDQIASYIQRGKSPTYAERSKIKIISQKCVQWSGFTETPCRFLDDEAFARFGPERVVRTGDLIWNSTGTGTIGRINVFDATPFSEQVFVADSHVTIVRLVNCDPRYIWCFLASPDIQRTLESDASGSTNQVELSNTYVRNTWIPLPPLAEQKRIVAKVNELMALCDELEARQAEEIELKRAVAASALYHLTEAKTPQEAADRWTLLAPSFGELFDDLKAIGALRDAIVKAACAGVIDGHLGASEKEYDAPFPIPRNWDWKKLGDLLDNVTSGSRGWSQYFAPHGSRFIRSQDIKLDRIEFEDPVFVHLPGNVEGTRTEVRPADLLLTITGANTGKCARVENLDTAAYVSQHVALLRPRNHKHSPFLHVWLTGNWAGRHLLLKDSYGIRSGLNLKQIRELPVPFPPLAEQERIVARVDELMALCDRLEEQVRKGERLNAELMASLVHVLTETDPDGGGAVESVKFCAETRIVAAPEQANMNAPETPGAKSARAVFPLEADKRAFPEVASEVDTKFKEAVLVGAIVKAFFDAGGEPIGNFRLQKAVYFARRHNGEHVGQMEYLKKAAGPYNPSMKYSGGIAIAKQKSWLRETRGRFGFGHVLGTAAEEMEAWFAKYGFGDSARWVAAHFRFKRNEEWETLATVDYAMEHLQSLGVEADATRVLQYIRADDEWRPKIEKLRLTEMSVGTAMLEVKALFSAEGGDDSV